MFPPICRTPLMTAKPMAARISPAKPTTATVATARGTLRCSSHSHIGDSTNASSPASASGSSSGLPK